MPRYIDADELIKALRDGMIDENDWSYESPAECRGVLEWAIAETEKMPTAEVAEVKHGRWIDDYDVYIGYMPRCSVCGKKILYAVSFDLTGQKYQMNYCPNCGAKMDADDTYCTEENCETFLRDLNCERCTK